MAAGRADQHSDLDFCLDVKDGVEGKVVRRVEKILSRLAPFDFSCERHNPHPKLRDFIYHLQGTPKTLVIDLEIQSHSRKFVFTKSLPGDKIKVLFSRKGGVRFRALDRAAFRGRIRKRIDDLNQTYVFHCDTYLAKNIARDNYTEAFYYYQRYAVEPLIELLRIRHCPLTWGELAFKHIRDDLPAGAVRTIDDFFRVNSVADIGKKTQQAKALFAKLLADVQPKYRDPARARIKPQRR